MLNAMGARISGIASNLLTIDGVEQLGECAHRVLPDMIEVGSFIGMAAMTAGEVTIRGAGCQLAGYHFREFPPAGYRARAKGG